MKNNQIKIINQKLDVSIKNKIFILFIVIISISVGIVGLFGFQNAKESYMKTSISVSSKETSDLSKKIESIVKNIPNDVLYNSNFYALKKLLIWESLDEKRKINNWKKVYVSALKDYVYNKKYYYNIRVLSISGDEKISVKYNEKRDTVYQVPENALGNKATSDYFIEALNLKKGEVYISTMNLNKHNGKIEKPYIPSVRYSTPLIDDNGELKGVLVITFNAQYILNEIATTKSLDENKEIQKYYLLNKDGYYLFNQGKNKMWGFELGIDSNFKNEYIGIFDTFNHKESNTFIDDNNIYSMHKIYPDKVNNKERYWYLVTTLDKDIALSSLKDFVNSFLMVFFGVLFLGLFFNQKIYFTTY